MKRRKSMDRLETLVQQFFEGSLERVLGGDFGPDVVAASLLRVLARDMQVGVPAELYEVTLNEAELALVFGEYPDLAAELTRMTREAVREHDGGRQPEVQLLGDPELHAGQVRILAKQRKRSSGAGTTSVRPSDEELVPRLLATLDAFIIVDGQRHIPLDRPFLSIGRDVQNDIVVDEAAVSRLHAQLRLRHGHFVLYDAGSRAGTTVNGQPVQEWVLRPGDLVYLASRVPLIYGEGLEDREQLPAAPADEGQETAVIPSKET